MKLYGNRKKSSRDSGKRAESPRPESSGRPPKKRGHRGVVVALCTIAVLVLGVWAAVSLYIRPPAKPTQPQSSADPSANVSGEAQPTGTQPDANHTPGMKDDFYTVLLLGTDEEDYNADVIMVAAMDVKNKKVEVVSVPRDTMLNVERANKKINGSYGVAKSKTGERADGAEAMKDAVATILGFRPDYYCQVTYTGFKNAIDAIGGVSYYVPETIKKSDTTPPIYLEKGEQVLDGEHALMLVRYRDYSDGDLHRIQNAQGFLKAAATQMLSFNNIGNVPSLVSIAMENASSDLDLGEMAWFGTQLMNIDSENINFHTIPVTMGWYKRVAYVFAEEEGTLELVNSTVNPFTRDITSSDVDIVNVQD